VPVASRAAVSSARDVGQGTRHHNITSDLDFSVRIPGRPPWEALWRWLIFPHKRSACHFAAFKRAQN